MAHGPSSNVHAAIFGFAHYLGGSLLANSLSLRFVAPRTNFWESQRSKFFQVFRDWWRDRGKMRAREEIYTWNFSQVALIKFQNVSHDTYCRVRPVVFNLKLGVRKWWPNLTATVYILVQFRCDTFHLIDETTLLDDGDFTSRLILVKIFEILSSRSTEILIFWHSPRWNSERF